MPRVQHHAPAKLNLILRVGAARADGFHPLASWFVPIDLHDTLTLELRAGPFTVNCSEPNLPLDDRNLVFRAANLFAMSYDVSLDGLSLHLEKRIPIGGGIGGGSSDAACTLQLLREHFNLPTDAASLSPLAEQLGSDVPFFLHGRSAWCTGRGEIITPIDPPRPRVALLCLPDFGVSTVAAFRQFDAKPAPPLDETPPQLSELDAPALLRELRNDLEPAAFAVSPRLEALHEALEETLGRPVRMSGSGSTLFTLYDDLDEARAAASVLHIIKTHFSHIG